jgi:serine/threonine protein phosphatase PrpC
LVLASDGLWDEISRKEAAVIASKPGNDTEMKKLAGSFFEEAIKNVSKKRGVSREFLTQAPPGPQKRNIHDDITILILSLQNQAQ